MAWAPDYTEREKLKDFVSHGSAGIDDTTDDYWYDLAISAGARAIDRFCSDPYRRGIPRRQFGILDSAEARYYTPHWSESQSRYVCEIDDLMDTTGVIVALDTDDDDVHETTTTAYQLRPRDGVSLNRPYTQLVLSRTAVTVPSILTDSVKMTARWGWTSFPSTVVQANILQSSRYLARREAPFGVRGTPDNDSEEELQFKLDVDVEHMLMEYRREVETLG